jgi:GT2 family glycosyltransferase
MTSSSPRVSIIIPHLSGYEHLATCLEAVGATISDDVETVVVDNGSVDGSVEAARRRFPWIRVLRSERNLGFAGGCNLGIRETRSKYIVLLNDDTRVAPGWLEALLSEADHNSRLAACQPKLLSVQEQDRFDYSGAAGGLIDIFGYPFALGRVFDTVETDHGQYDGSRPIFWASGTAMLLRRSALEEVGLLDERFFAHMEEIDLCWRLHLCGYEVRSVPVAVVYHRSGATLAAGAFLKKYLNHRNNLVMLLKNYGLASLLWIFPIRLALEVVTLLYAIASRDFGRAGAVIAALGYLLTHPYTLWTQRRAAQSVRRAGDGKVMEKMYRGSIVWSYFVRGVRRAADLPGIAIGG